EPARGHRAFRGSAKVRGSWRASKVLRAALLASRCLLAKGRLAAPTGSGLKLPSVVSVWRSGSVIQEPNPTDRPCKGTHPSIFDGCSLANQGRHFAWAPQAQRRPGAAAWLSQSTRVGLLRENTSDSQ